MAFTPARQRWQNPLVVASGEGRGMPVNFRRIVGAGAIACLAAGCTTGQTPPPNPSVAASLPTPGSAPVPKKKGVTIVAPYAPPQGPPEYIPPKPKGPDAGYFV